MKGPKAKLWKVFAKYIKLRDNKTCFTCGKKADGYALHAGHFIPKAAGGLALYFHEDNVHAQCAGCNLFLAGNQYIYGEKLGKETVDALYRCKQQIIKDYPYDEKIAYYEKKIKELE